MKTLVSFRDEDGEFYYAEDFVPVADVTRLIRFANRYHEEGEKEYWEMRFKEKMLEHGIDVDKEKAKIKWTNIND